LALPVPSLVQRRKTEGQKEREKEGRREAEKERAEKEGAISIGSKHYSTPVAGFG